MSADINSEFCIARNKVLVQNKNEACEDGKKLIESIESELTEVAPGVVSSLFVDHALLQECDQCGKLLRKASGIAFDKK